MVLGAEVPGSLIADDDSRLQSGASLAHQVSGNCVRQWLAMSIRRAIHALPRSAMCPRILSRAPMRPGRPIIRRCKPIDIIFRRVRAFSMKPIEGVDHIRCE